MRIPEASTAAGGQVGTMRDGKVDQKFLLEGDDNSPNNYLLNVGLTGAGGWGTPRHRHNFDQIRSVSKGKLPRLARPDDPGRSSPTFPRVSTTARRIGQGRELW